LNVVRFFQVRLGSSNARGPFRIVRKQQQALAGFIQSTNGSEPVHSIVTLHQRVDRVSSFFIGSGGKQTAWLIHHEINFAAQFNQHPIHFNAVFLQVHWSFRISPQGPIQPDPSFANEFGSSRSRAVAQLRERTRQADSSLLCFHRLDRSRKINEVFRCSVAQAEISACW
jgi:hypothetical protein